MNRIKKFEGFALPYDEGANLLSLRFLDILKDNPKAVDEFKEELRKEKIDGSLFNLDWFKYGLKMRELKKLPGGVPSLGQVTTAAKQAYSLYKRWVKDNPTMKSRDLVTLNKASGVLENVTNDDDLIRNSVKAYCDAAKIKWRLTSKGDVYTVTNIDSESEHNDEEQSTPIIFKIKSVGDKFEIDPYSIVIEGTFMIPKVNAVEFFHKIGEAYWNHVPNKYSKRGPKHSWDKAKDEMENLVSIYSSTSLPNVAKYGVFDLPE